MFIVFVDSSNRDRTGDVYDFAEIDEKIATRLFLSNVARPNIKINIL